MLNGILNIGIVRDFMLLLWVGLIKKTANWDGSKTDNR